MYLVHNNIVLMNINSKNIKRQNFINGELSIYSQSKNNLKIIVNNIQYIL